MADVARMPASSTALSRPRAETLAIAREAKRHAAVAERDDSPDARRALARLDKLLASEKEPRPDVPRGYYLNFTV